MKNKEIELGNEVQDVVTGFQGIAVSRTTYLTGCDRIGINPKAKDGKLEDGINVDITSVKYIGKGCADHFKPKVEESKEVETLTKKGGPATYRVREMRS